MKPKVNLQGGIETAPEYSMVGPVFGSPSESIHHQ